MNTASAVAIPLTPQGRAALPAGLKEWLRSEAVDVFAVLGWLKDHPVDLRILATLAQLERDPELAGWFSDTPATGALLERHTERVQQFLRAASFGACARCFSPVGTFPDGRALDWPGLELHRDDCATLPTSPPRRPFESRR